MCKCCRYFCHDKYECGLGDWGILIESVLTRIELMKAINFSELFTLANYHGRVILNSMRIFCNIGVVADHSRGVAPFAWVCRKFSSLRPQWCLRI